MKSAPARAEYRLHAAVVFASLGRLVEAAAELAEAVCLDPELEKTDAVKTLHARLGR